MKETLFLKLLPYEDKSWMLSEAIESVSKGYSLNSIAYVADPASFRQIPGSTFAYWVSERIGHLFAKLSQIEGEGRTVKQGLVTADDFHFLRLWWEVVSEKTITGTMEATSEQFLQQTFAGKCWIPFAKGGIYSPYYADLHLVVNWKLDGDEIKNFKDSQTGRLLSRPQNTSFFFLPGITWSRRTQRGLSVRVFPQGCLFADKGPAIFSNPDSLPFLLGLANSIAFQGFVALQMAFGSYEVGVIQRTPVPDSSVPGGEKLGKLALLCVALKRDLDQVNETSHVFHLPALLHSNSNTLATMITNWQRKVSKTEQLLANYQREIDEIAFHLYGVEGEDQHAIEESLKHAKLAKVSEGESETGDEGNEVEITADPRGLVAALLSYTIGCAYGRWDMRFATHERPIPELPDPFSPLPACSPGMLTGNDGLPLPEVPTAYPLAISHEGIMVDDPDLPEDIVRHARDVLGVIWNDNTETIEQEVCELLGVKELRDYFRRPGNDGFWTDHIKLYSKSRRKAPIYWLLQSTKRNYGLWLYYHRLDNDMLFKALTKYIEPKIRLEESRLEQTRTQLASFGTTGREVKQLERQFDRQENLVGELYDFRDKLRRAANLHLEPDLNDGVVLNIAPLWELVPWSEAKKYWEELLAGKYEWSSISKQLHVRGIIK
jgi:hypothetical protein